MYIPVPYSVQNYVVRVCLQMSSQTVSWILVRIDKTIHVTCMVTVPVTRTKTYGEQRFYMTPTTLWNGLSCEPRNVQKLDLRPTSLVKLFMRDL